MKSEEMEVKIKALEERLRVTEDIEAIKQLQVHYVNLLMDTRWDEILDLFTEDAVVAIHPMPPIRGRAEIKKWLEEMVAKLHVGMEGDFVVHPIISVDGDKARGNWLLYMMYFHPHTHRSLFWTQGYYDCEYTRVAGRWRFSNLRWTNRHSPPRRSLDRLSQLISEQRGKDGAA